MFICQKQFTERMNLVKKVRCAHLLTNGQRCRGSVDDVVVKAFTLPWCQRCFLKPPSNASAQQEREHEEDVQSYYDAIDLIQEDMNAKALKDVKKKRNHNRLIVPMYLLHLV